MKLPPRFEGVQRIERVVRFPNDGRLTAAALAQLPLVAEEGRIVELGQVARIEEAPTPAMVRRKNGQRRLGFNVRVAEDLGGTARRIKGQPFNVVFLCVGVLSIIIGITTSRKSGNDSGPPNP